MNDLSDRRKRLALFLSLIALALGLTAAKTHFAPQTGKFEVLILSSIMPLQVALSKGTQRLHDVWHGYIQLTQVHQENLQLRQQVETVQGQLHQYREAYLQQQRLRELLDFRSQTFQAATPVEVVSIDPSQWSQAITVNKGMEHGLHKNNTVMTHLGLVGHVIETAPRYATVLLLTDRRSAVDALVQRTRSRGVAVGKSKRRLELRYVDIYDDIRMGDRIISSGLGKMYPKGILIGTVTAVRSPHYGLFHEIDVQPAVDFLKLEEVLALKSNE
ncbi:MAG: rod shape-determining protein MreC [Candidatus Tectomicrobia bacterium]|nr:rod shape-determining protein MreC [Candidatus Tectomicrobia bacterium]